MKTFFETWTNPKTKESEQIEVQEYFLEDWEDGALVGKPGKNLHHNVSENKYYYSSLSFDEYSKIEVRRKEIYFEKAEKEFLKYVDIFQKRYEKSEAKERLIKTEIELYEKLLFQEKLPIYVRTNVFFPLEEIIMPSGEMPDFSKMFSHNRQGINPDYNGEMIFIYGPKTLDSITISDIRKLYQQIIVNGEKDFSRTNSTKCHFNIGAGDSNFIRVEAMAKFYNYLKSFNEAVATKNETLKIDLQDSNNTKSEVLAEALKSFRFFDLELVNSLSKEKQSELVELMSSKGLPYSVAMFDFLGFLDFLANEYFSVKNQLHKEISKWFKADQGGRMVRGNISTLRQVSNESKTRYTAHNYKQKVQTDYQNLK